MKGNNISGFPTLTDKMVEKCCIDPESYSFIFSYYRDIENPHVVLEQDETNNLFLSLYDKSASWSVDTHNLIIDGKYKISNPSVLFGPDGIAPSNSKIELHLRWGSSENKKRGITYIGTILNTMDELVFPIHHVFPINSIRGQIKLSFEYTLQDSVVLQNDERHLADKKGTIIGEQQLSILDIDAKDNSFPIDYINEPGEPLWKLRMQDVNYREKPFDANYVLIQLNRAHPKFSRIDVVSRKSDFEPSMLNEVLSSAISLMIEFIRSNNGMNLADILNEDQSSWTPGCIAEAIYNFQQEPMFFDYKDPISTAISIRQYFDKTLDSL